jgi:uncharacterized surface protein with fasciclin (FAS1) repeats
MQNFLLALVAIVIVGFGVYLITDTNSTDVDTYTVDDTMTDTVTPEEPEVSDTADTAVPGTIVEVASSNGSFDTLVAAVSAADLAATLSGPGPFTVFAPTDTAFAALPAGTLDELLLPANQDQLTDILTYHVISGEVQSTDLMDGMTATTVNGEEVTIGVGSTGVTVNGASVVTADIEASNGIIHVIDEVLLPPTE